MEIKNQAQDNRIPLSVYHKGSRAKTLKGVAVCCFILAVLFPIVSIIITIQESDFAWSIAVAIVPSLFFTALGAICGGLAVIVKTYLIKRAILEKDYKIRFF